MRAECRKRGSSASASSRVNPCRSSWCSTEIIPRFSCLRRLPLSGFSSSSSGSCSVNFTSSFNRPISCMNNSAAAASSGDTAAFAVLGRTLVALSPDVTRASTVGTGVCRRLVPAMACKNRSEAFSSGWGGGGVAVVGGSTAVGGLPGTATPFSVLKGVQANCGGFGGVCWRFFFVISPLPPRLFRCGGS